MFWGMIIKPDKKFDLRKLSNMGEILRISKIHLNDTKPNAETEVFMKFENNECLVARLGKQAWEKDLELFVNLNQDIEIFTEGDSDVCVLGYFEPVEKDEEIKESSSEEELSVSESEEVIIPPKRKK